MTYCLRIADIPATERPRERLLALGQKNLATAELIAILLGTGQGPGKLSAVGLGQHILQQLSQHQRDPLEYLRDISAQELMNIPGVLASQSHNYLSWCRTRKTRISISSLRTHNYRQSWCGCGGVKPRFNVASTRAICSITFRR